MSHLQVEHVAKSFGDTIIMEDLSFSVEKNEFVSIVGPSGSGKSTIFNMIGGIVKPDKGSIILDGEAITGKRGSISYMPQTPSLLPWRTILENVVLGQELVGLVDNVSAKEMLIQAGLADYENAYPHELSGGMKQRAAFIRALLSPQSLILLDEPFSALDELRRVEMHEWLLGILAKHDRTVLFVTHNIEEALILSDRILVLSEKPARIVADYKVSFEKNRGKDFQLSEEFMIGKREIFDSLTGKRTNG